MLDGFSYLVLRWEPYPPCTEIVIVGSLPRMNTVDRGTLSTRGLHLSSRPLTPLPASVSTALRVTSARSTQNVPDVPSTDPRPSAPVRPEPPRDCVREYPSVEPDS